MIYSIAKTAYERGIIWVCAAGKMVESVIAPAVYPGTIAVAATFLVVLAVPGRLFPRDSIRCLLMLDWRPARTLLIPSVVSLIVLITLIAASFIVIQNASRSAG